MHITEGALSVSHQGMAIMAGGFAIAALGTAIGLRRMDHERIPQVAMLSAVFFVVSLFPIPHLGVTSVHLLLTGLVGLVLGWAAFPAIAVALFVQAMLFGDGGFTTLGVNTVVMATPAVACHYAFRRLVQARQERMVFVAGFLAGAGAIIMGAVLHAAALALATPQYQWLALTALGFHLLAAGVEGVVTASIVVFLRKVRPELLSAPVLANPSPEAAHG